MEINQSKISWKYSIAFVGAIILYLAVSFNQPINQATNFYQLSDNQILWLKISIALPLLFIWSANFFGFLYFKKYSLFVKDSPEGKAFNLISKMLLILLAASILNSLWTSLAPYMKQGFETKRVFSIVSNYINILGPLLAYCCALRGAISLAKTNGIVVDLKKKMFYLVPLFIVIVAVYGYLIFNNQYRTFSDNPRIQPTYFLNDFMIIFTIMLPMVVSWILGVGAIIYIREFVKQVRGIFYKNALKPLALGLIMIIGLSISLQYLSQLGSSFVGIKLSAILVLIYIILLVIAVGYYLIAHGARRLTKIEVV